MKVFLERIRVEKRLRKAPKWNEGGLIDLKDLHKRFISIIRKHKFDTPFLAKEIGMAFPTLYTVISASDDRILRIRMKTAFKIQDFVEKYEAMESTK